MDNLVSEEQLEELREKAVKRARIVYVLSILSIPLYAYLFYRFMKEEESVQELFFVKLAAVSLVLAAGTLVLLWHLIVSRTYSEFNRSFKEKYVLHTIEKIPGFERLQYESRAGFSWDEVRNSAVTACGDEKYFESEDLLRGEYEGISFIISDVTARKLVRRNKKTRLEEVFDGQILCLFQFDDTKISKGHVQLFQKKFLSDISGWKAEHRIRLEREEFNSRFEIFADDEYNAYYILTPRRMEKIMEFTDTVKAQTSLVFLDDKLFVAVKKASLFEASTDRPVAEQTESIQQDVRLIQKAREMLISD